VSGASPGTTDGMDQCFYDSEYLWCKDFANVKKMLRRGEKPILVYIYMYVSTTVVRFMYSYIVSIYVSLPTMVEMFMYNYIAFPHQFFSSTSIRLIDDVARQSSLVFAIGTPQSCFKNYLSNFDILLT
jgi:hypothetical protein